MGESIEYDRSAPEMVRSSQFPNKKHCPSPRKGGKPKQEKKQGQDKSYSAATSPPPDMQHLEAMNVPMTQSISPNIGSSLPPHHAMPSSGRDHHTSSPRNHRTPGIGGEGEKKTRGRVRIRMEFISNKLRRYTTFSKRKTGIMKKAYELSTLTGTQVMLLVASETGHVYTFATPKLQPMITSETGKALIQTCLNSPDPPPPNRNPDERMSQTGYEETELGYPVSTEEAEANKSERHMYPNSDPNMENSPTHSFPGLNMPHGSFPMNMAFIPATTKQGDSNNSNMSGPGYTVQQQLGNFGTIFPPPPPTTYSNSPQNMGNMTHMSGGGHMGRIPENMSPGHNIDIGNMVTLQRNPASTQSASADSPSPTYIYTSSPRSQPPEDTKLDIKQHENDNDTRDHGSPNSL